MTNNQRIWAMARDELAAAVVSLGYPEEFASLLAKQLKSPRAMERMARYLSAAKPRSMEMIVDEMLAIAADQETWKKRIEAREAQAGITAWLNSPERRNTAPDDET